MPGRLQKDFRSGNLAENLGVLLLKGIAAVAEVPRPEDVGLDAIATLLRLKDDDNYYAEDTFVVQLKSASVKTIKYEGYELDWLIGQSQPMFIGVVSLREASISLYPTIYVNHAVLALNSDWIQVHFGASKSPPIFNGQKNCPWKGAGDKGAIVWLGAPLLKWTIDDIANKKWGEESYCTLKRYLTIAKFQIELFALGQCSTVEWSTNDSDSITEQFGMMKGGLGDFDEVAQRYAPCFRALMLRVISSDHESAKTVLRSLVAMTDSLREMGIEVDPDDLLQKFSPLLQTP